MQKIDIEETLFKAVADEIRHGHLSEGLWLKANVDAGGNERQAQLLYTKYRVAQLTGEIADSTITRQIENKKQIVRDFRKLCWDYLPFTIVALVLIVLLLSGVFSNAR
ncbi:MAG: hypothetical protein Q8K61_01335 [Gallionella sp.]|nr:hypothetical protein [Gallionella sp.]